MNAELMTRPQQLESTGAYNLAFRRAVYHDEFRSWYYAGGGYDINAKAIEIIERLALADDDSGTIMSALVRESEKR